MNEWTDDIEGVMENVRINSIIFSNYHKNRYYIYKSYLKYFKLPLIFLSSINSIVAIGLTSTVRYLKFFNTASAISWGEDIPVMTIPIPANTQGAGVVIPFYFGVDFRVGIAIGITAGSADNNEDPIDAGDVIVNLTYA